jgi:thioredoxin 2
MFRNCKVCGQGNELPPARLMDDATCGACGGDLAAPSAPINADAASFDDLVSNLKLPVLVDFWAPWCGPCRRLGPELEKVAAELAGKAVVVKVNTDRNQELAARFGVRGIPNLLVLSGGAPQRQHSGVVSAREMTSWLLELA